MKLDKFKFKIVKNILSKELCNFLFQYFIMKDVAVKYMFDTRYISPYSDDFGTFNDPQAPGYYSMYADPATEVILVNLKQKMEKELKTKLIETYSYARVYRKGSILYRHTDRSECAFSTTLNLGGDNWPIYLDTSGKKNQAGIKIELSQGDMLIYRGDIHEHWREEFTKDVCVQTFLHYNLLKKANKFDGRPALGLPSFYRNNK